MAEYEFTIKRTCNTGMNNLGFRGSDLTRRLTSGEVKCPVDGTLLTDTVSSDDLFPSSDELSRQAKQQSFELIGGWCDDPCPSCKVPANMTNLEIIALDLKPPAVPSSQKSLYEQHLQRPDDMDDIMFRALIDSALSRQVIRVNYDDEQIGAGYQPISPQVEPIPPLEK